MLIHAICGGKLPSNLDKYVNEGFLNYTGDQHNPYSYEWISSKLKELSFDELYGIYVGNNYL